MDSVGEGEGGKIWENDIETCKIPCKKRDASPGSMHDTGCLGHFNDFLFYIFYYFSFFSLFLSKFSLFHFSY